MAERSVRHRDKAGNVVEPSEAADTDWLPMRELHGGPEHSAPQMRPDIRLQPIHSVLIRTMARLDLNEESIYQR